MGANCKVKSKEDGWALFECWGSDNGTPQLQRVDELAIFETDKEALIYVINKADEGSEKHKKALMELVEKNPKEFLMLTK